jgi:hypothetical protein
MPFTYEPIATQTLGSAASSVTFSSITGAYTDLMVIINGKTVTSTADLYMRFNNDTGTNYSNTSIIGDGSTAASTRGSGVSVIKLNTNSTGDSTVWKINIMNYANTTTYKTTLSRFDFAGTLGGAEAYVNLWRDTSAINRIDILPSTGNLDTGMVLTLYGILAA